MQNLIKLKMSLNACEKMAKKQQQVTIPSSPPPKKLRKSMALAIAAIIILSALVGTLVLSRPLNNLNPTPNPTPTPTVIPYNFKISTDQPSFTIRQGYSWQVSLNLETVSGNIQSISISDVNLTADSSSSKIKTDFDSTDFLYNKRPNPTDENSTTIPSGFSNKLSITVPEPTPTNNYTINVTAKIGSISHNISILVGVESSMVTLSGTINPGNTGWVPSQIEFWDWTSPHGAKYTADVHGNTYSISVPNYKTYLVAVWDFRFDWRDCDQNFWLEVPPGSTSVTKDFTIIGY